MSAEMRERGFVNGDRGDNFNINLTHDQKEQYGLQFNETPQAPGIVGEFQASFTIDIHIFPTFPLCLPNSND